MVSAIAVVPAGKIQASPVATSIAPASALKRTESPGETKMCDIASVQKLAGALKAICSDELSDSNPNVVTETPATMLMFVFVAVRDNPQNYVGKDAHVYVDAAKYGVQKLQTTNTYKVAFFNNNENILKAVRLLLENPESAYNAAKEYLKQRLSDAPSPEHPLVKQQYNQAWNSFREARMKIVPDPKSNSVQPRADSETPKTQMAAKTKFSDIGKLPVIEARKRAMDCENPRELNELYLQYPGKDMLVRKWVIMNEHTSQPTICRCALADPDSKLQELAIAHLDESSRRTLVEIIRTSTDIRLVIAAVSNPSMESHLLKDIQDNHPDKRLRDAAKATLAKKNIMKHARNHPHGPVNADNFY